MHADQRAAVERVREAAFSYVLARVARDKARTDRNAIGCVNFTEADDEGPAWGTPCFKQVDNKGGYIPVAEYCAHCQKRQSIHEAKNRHAREMGVAWRKLRREVLAATLARLDELPDKEKA